MPLITKANRHTKNKSTTTFAKTPQHITNSAAAERLQIQASMVNRNQYNLPTYFQIGRNSIENHDSLYINDPSNQGLVGNFRGKKQDIPIAANLLSKSDSAERLNLKSKSPTQKKVAEDSP